MPNLYTMINPFVFNRRPVSRNEAIRVAHWLEKRLGKMKITNYSVGYKGTDKEGYFVELTDRNIIDKITPNPAEYQLPRNR